MPRRRTVATLVAVLAAACGGEPARFPIARPTDFVRDVGRSEDAAQAAERDLRASLLPSLASPTEPPSADEAFAPGFRARFPGPDDGRAVPDGGLDIRLYGGADEEVLDASELVLRLEEHTHGWTVRRTELELDRFLLAPDGTSAVGRCELRIAGLEVAGYRVDLRTTCELDLVHDGNTWRIRRLDCVEATRVADRGMRETDEPRFADATRETGFSYNVSRENRDRLQLFIDRHNTLAVAGLTALDWNDDGFWDLLATRADQLTTLFLNDGAGGFVPGPLPVVSPAESPSFFLWVDLDGDGLEELVGSRVLEYGGTRASCGIWTRRGSEWEVVRDALPFEIELGVRRISVQTVVPFDVEGDGDLDLFVGVYGDARSRGLDYNTVEAHDGADNHLFVNHGDLRFTEESDARGISGIQYTYVAQAFDFDADGDVDLFEGNDFGPNILWQNDGEGHFRPDDALGLGGVSAYTMGVTLADWDNTGEWSLYISNMSSRQGARIAPLPEELSETMRSRVAEIARGNMLYTRGPDGAWREHAVAAGCNEAGWAWACVFCDLDNDADKDLYVTNGFTSHSDRELDDWQTYYWRQVAADGGFLERGERSVDVNTDVSFEGSFNGYERDRLYHNPDGPSDRLVEAGYVYGLDGDHDGRSVVPVDVDGDGDVDLALWTLQGLVLLENRSPARRFARIRLHTTGSHASGLGAIVSVTTGAVTQRDHAKLTDGFQSQPPSDLHFGLGDAEHIDALRVEWPSGRVDEWRDLPADRRLEVTEGGESVDDAPVARWPAVSRPQPDSDPSIDTILPTGSGGSEAVASPGKPSVLRFVPTSDPRGPWPGAEDLVLAHPDVRWVMVSPDREAARELRAGATRAPAGVVHFVADERFLRGFFPDEPELPSTFVFDQEHALVRAFRREVTPDEIALLLAEVADEPPFPGLLVRAGRLALARNQFRLAESLFKRAIEVDEDRAPAWEGLGRAHRRLGRLDLAEVDYERSVVADPDYGIGHYNLGVTRVRRNRPKEAIAPLQRSIEIGGPIPARLLALAEASRLAGEPDLAVASYWKAIDADPGRAEIHLELGQLLGQLERYEDARARFKRALELEPDLEGAERALALVERLMRIDGR